MLEYTKEDEIVIQYEFKEPETLVRHAIESINSNNNIKNIYKFTFVKDNSNNVVPKYGEVQLIDTNNIMIKIYGIYEKGIAFTISCYASSFGKEVDIPTEAILIFEKGKDPIFIISKIDNSIIENQKINGTANYGNQLISYNDELVYQRLSDLGARIDINKVTMSEDDNFFNKKKNEKKRTLLSEKLRLIIMDYLSKMNNIELSKIKKK